MKRFYIFLTILLVSIQIKTDNTALLNQLQIMHTKYIRDKNHTYGLILQNAFNTFHSEKESAVELLLQHHNIVNLFFLKSLRIPEETTFNKNLNSAQNIMLVYLYNKLFKNYIAHTQSFVEQIICALEYWNKEMFYDSLSIFRKHPTYWFHSPEYKKQIQKHVQHLEQIKQETTMLLGMALHGRYELLQIQDDTNIVTQLTKAIDPMLQNFHATPQNNILQPEIIFQDAKWLHLCLKQHLHDCQKTFNNHKKPHHLVQHKFLYGCVAMTLIAAYTAYKMHENEIPEYQRKSVQAWNYFLREYIQIPAADIKDALWEQKNQKLVLLQKPNALPTDHSWKTWMIDSRLNHFAVWLSEIVDHVFDGVNKNIEVTNKSIKQQQLTLASAAIAPVIISTYITYRITNHAYNKYVKHESWHRPMQLIIREIDKILNKLVCNQEASYADDGILHVLIVRLKTFISCLPNEELQLIEKDLEELSAYHLSCEQKRGVLDRIYRTYDFLN